LSEAQLGRPEDSEAQDYGLKEDWSHIEEILGEVIPVYERVNRFISLGTDLKIRREGIAQLLRSMRAEQSTVPKKVMDLGSGTGKMSQLLANEDGHDTIFLLQLDALQEMMRAARRRIEAERLLGTYENIPLVNGVLDGAMAGFAIRDARNLSLALEQIAQSIRDGGYFLIVDLSKPDSKTKRALIAIYWKLISPILATVASPKLGRKFASLYTTYRRLPTRSEFSTLVRKVGFDFEYENYHMLGGSAVLLLKKSRSKNSSASGSSKF
jgi:demethylmenaquinone methyltransferase / 2-methoxy-6-polyprenyl-1,4-benzoquinol methylase